jgi:diacylglycerol kinase (ATP)
METPTHSGLKSARRGKPEGADAAKDGRKFKGKTGIRRLINAALYSRDGLLEAWRNEEAFRQEVILAVILVPIAVWLPVNVVEKILLVGVVLLVMIVELLNSAVEVAVDRDSFEINSLGKRAKDLGSAAVALALVLAGGTWVAILWTNFGP